MSEDGSAILTEPYGLFSQSLYTDSGLVSQISSRVLLHKSFTVLVH
jgi:hypothetical protein